VFAGFCKALYSALSVDVVGLEKRRKKRGLFRFLWVLYVWIAFVFSKKTFCLNGGKKLAGFQAVNQHSALTFSTNTREGWVSRLLQIQKTKASQGNNGREKHS